jgi:DNA-binding transcriptional regulator YiaG
MQRPEVPTKEQIREARVAAGLTQAEAARIVHRPSYRTWQDWERGRTKMPLDAWELFMIKTGQHPKAMIDSQTRGLAPSKPNPTAGGTPWLTK